MLHTKLYNGAKPLHIIFNKVDEYIRKYDKVDEYIRNYDETKYIALFYSDEKH